MKVPEFNPTAGIPKTSYGPKSGGPTFDNATWFSTVRPSMNDPMTLVERLRNPAYHGSGLTRGKPADLDVKQTVADMAEAANEIDSLRAILRECLGDYGHQNFTDRHGMAARIRSVLKVE